MITDMIYEIIHNGKKNHDVLMMARISNIFGSFARNNLSQFAGLIFNCKFTLQILQMHCMHHLKCMLQLSNMKKVTIGPRNGLMPACVQAFYKTNAK